MTNTTDKATKPPKKNPYDKTATARSLRRDERVRESGGAVITIRATGDLLKQIDTLAADRGITARTDLIKAIVTEKMAERDK